MYRRAIAILALIVAVQVPRARAQTEIDTLALSAHSYFLAHDLLRGRATGTPGADMAAHYIASQCRALGLLPLADGYDQDIPLEQASFGPSTRLTVHGSGVALDFEYPMDFTPNVGGTSALVDYDGPAVYVGPVDRLAAEPSAELKLSGAVAVILGPRADVEQMESLRLRGAVGVILLAPEPQTYDLYRRSRGNTRLYHADSTIRSSFIPSLPAVIAGPAVTRALLTQTPLDRNGSPIPGPLARNVSVRLEIERKEISAQNVVCHLPGGHVEARDTAIALSAHYDHLGVLESGASEDSIYNGFADNAAGVAALLAIAGAMVADTTTPMRHSVLFLFFTGEERGLLGSDYYVARPLWPLRQTRAVINIDAGAPPGRPVSWRLAGVDSTGLGAVGIAVAGQQGWRVTTSPPRANSDYYPFVREGVPGVFIVPAPDPYEGLTADSSTTLRERWGYYHHPDDEWTDDFPFTGLARYAEYGYLLARELDRSMGPGAP